MSPSFARCLTGGELASDDPHIDLTVLARRGYFLSTSDYEEIFATLITHSGRVNGRLIQWKPNRLTGRQLSMGCHEQGRPALRRPSSTGASCEGGTAAAFAASGENLPGRKLSGWSPSLGGLGRSGHHIETRPALPSIRCRGPRLRDPFPGFHRKGFPAADGRPFVKWRQTHQERYRDAFGGVGRV